jgi:hypothetical protein
MNGRTTSVLLVLFLCGLLITSTAHTSGSQGYDLSWWTVDGGGGASTIAGGYSLSGSIGQPDVGLLAGSDYSLAGGFWGGGKLTIVYKIYLPLVQRDF